jgi:hypothetical protein
MQTGDRLGAYRSDTGYQNIGDGSVKFLEKHKLMCADGSLLSRFQAKAGGGKTMTFEYTCSSYDVKEYKCTDRYTQPNADWDYKKISSLSKQEAMCNDNEAMQGFRPQMIGTKFFFGIPIDKALRWQYTCCRAIAFPPTPAPISDPTMAPSVEPSLNPTLHPVADPTHRPSQEPVAKPTYAPTDTPIIQPTESPTLTPTLTPTEEPSKTPISDPTYRPSNVPISVPTLEPTLTPISKPTYSPSLEPVSTPTLAPISDPTFVPTLQPVANPTIEPTFEPTGAPFIVPEPTQEPRANPTQEPTVEPTKRPISDPTKEPSFTPTPLPSAEPVSEPTKMPSFTPTPKPSAEPTLEPTTKPTDLPISKPTYEPTAEPTLAPTEEPISQPTIKPTLEPTVAPISTPTHEPTAEPTLGPSPVPTDAPVSNPTLNPISTPTIEPSPYPTLKPTLEPTFKDIVKPPNMSEDEFKKVEDIIDQEKKFDEIEASSPSKPIVIQEPEESPEAPISPDSPPADNKSIDESGNIKPVGEGAIYAPDYDNSVNFKICSFTFTKRANPVEVPYGCALISVSELNSLPAGVSAQSAYICGSEEAKIDSKLLKKAGLVSADSKSDISTIIPGKDTGVTFYISEDFTGTHYTYTSGYHPDLTQIHLHGSNKGNDAIKSLIFNSNAKPDMSYPPECSK